MPGLFCASELDEGRSTVWIMPLRSMHEQYHTRCQKHGMSSGTWSPQMTIAGVSLHVILSVESTEWKECRTFLNSLHAIGRLARIIIDEAHLALTHESFRPVMDTIQWLGGQGVQIVLQTATLPPSLEPRLIEKAGLTGCFVTRSKTARANISYNVLRSSSPDTLLDHVEEEYMKARNYSTTNRILIFCLSKFQARQTAARLGIPHCDAEMTKEDIDKLLVSFRTGRVLGISCTSILGVALDVPGITHVIHQDYPRDSLSYTQEVGRLGRDANTEKAWSIVILPPKHVDLPIPQSDPFGSYLLRRSLDSVEHCRRLLVQMFLDGAAEPCALMEGKVHLCDICAAQSHQQPSRSERHFFPAGVMQNCVAGAWILSFVFIFLTFL